MLPSNPLTRGKKQKVQTLLQQNRLEEARVLLEQLCETDRRDAEAWHVLGTVNHHLGRLEEASASYNRVIALQPGHAEALYGLGLVHQAQGNPADALLQYQQALASQPDHLGARFNLGSILEESGQLHEAAQCYEGAIRLNPNRAEFHYNLGNVQRGLQQHESAEQSYRRAIALHHELVDAHVGLGVTLRRLGRLEEAADSYLRALAIKPGDNLVHNMLGVVLAQQGRLEEAADSYRRSLAINPNDPEVLNNLGVVQTGQGRLDDAIESYRKALGLNPKLVEVHLALLCLLLYHPTITPENLFEEHRRFETLHARKFYGEQRPHANPPEPERRLRIGYVSSDLRTHPVAHWLIQLLESSDRRNFETYLYAELAGAGDEITTRVRQLTDHWCLTAGLSDEVVAEQIRRDGIDILVFLAGHFDKNRLLVSAYKPAPIQVSYLDAATSGLAAMDYFITDIIMNPKDTRELFSERLLRLPTYHLYPPLVSAPVPGPLPALSAGHITFGSFNNPTKITPAVVALWSRVLKSVPDSCLLLKYKNVYAHDDSRRYLLERFTQHGVDTDRIHLAAEANTREDHLKWYERIDVTLDPFPFNGATTSFESLWMGVPVVSLLGQTMMSRWSGSMVIRAGFPELAARTEDQYIECAKRLAMDTTGLAKLRSGLREHIAHSTLCNAKLRSRQIERAYRYIWRKWCSTRTGA